MIKLDDVTKGNIKEHSANWLQVYSLFTLIGHQPDIDKTFLYAKDPYEAKYQLLINKRENIKLSLNTRMI